MAASVAAMLVSGAGTLYAAGPVALDHLWNPHATVAPTEIEKQATESNPNWDQREPLPRPETVPPIVPVPPPRSSAASVPDPDAALPPTGDAMVAWVVDWPTDAALPPTTDGVRPQAPRDGALPPTRDRDEFIVVASRSDHALPPGTRYRAARPRSQPSPRDAAMPPTTPKRQRPIRGALGTQLDSPLPPGIPSVPLQRPKALR